MTRSTNRILLGLAVAAGLAITAPGWTAAPEKKPAPHACTDCTTSVLSYDETAGEPFREGWQRRIIHTNNLMMVLIDVDNGPMAQPDPFHSHPHEQAAYVAEGELLYFCEGEAPRRLKAGDMYGVPSGKKHAVQILTKHARLIDSFTPVREDFLKK